MASTKPNRTARWATDGGVVLEPTSGEKDTGWIVDDKPPARHMNFLQNMAFQWFRWLDERHDDGGTPADYVTHPEDPVAGVAGKATYRGGNSVGTDLAGGDSELAGGEGTGTGSSKAKIKASTAGSTGAAPNVPEDYVVADGATGLVNFLKGIVNSIGPGLIASNLETNNNTVYRGRENTGATTAAVPVTSWIAKSSGDMVDGFGVSMPFSIQDDASPENEIAAIHGVRDGADSSGELLLRTNDLGAQFTRARIRASGLFNSLFGLQGDGDPGVINGAGVIGRGLVASGALGTAETEPGAGLHGVGSEIAGGATTGYGAIAQGSNTGTPTRSSLRVVPQTNEPSAGQAGDLWVGTDSKKIAIHDGTRFRFPPVQDFETLADSSDIVNTSAETTFSNGTRTLDADTLRVGSVIRLLAFGGYTRLDNTQDLTIRIKLAGQLAGLFVMNNINDDGFWSLEGTIIVRTATTAIGTSRGIAGITSQVDNEGLVVAAISTDITINQDLIITAEWTVANATNSINMRGFIVDIT